MPEGIEKEKLKGPKLTANQVAEMLSCSYDHLLKLVKRGQLPCIEYSSHGKSGRTRFRRLFYESVMARDYPVIMAVLIIGAFLTLIGNLVADIAYSYADPRIRYEKH